jgi:hypothetical protein
MHLATASNIAGNLNPFMLLFIINQLLSRHKALSV